MESQTTLVRTQRGVELHTVAPVHLQLRRNQHGSGPIVCSFSAIYLALVIFPNYTELNNSFRNRGNPQSFAVLRILLEKSRVLKGDGELY